MANNVIKRIWNQNKMVNIEALQGMAFQAEDGGHTFEISGVDNGGNLVALSGTVAGVFVRPDNADIALSGTVSDGKVYVTLSDACYAVPGKFVLTIFVTADSKKTAVYAAIGTVNRTSGGAVAGDTPQDVVDLINAIAAAVSTIPADYTDLMAAVAPTYSPDAVYPANSYRWYNGELYENPNPITTPESWTAGHWRVASIGDDVSAITQISRNLWPFDSSKTFTTYKYYVLNDTILPAGTYSVSAIISSGSGIERCMVRFDNSDQEQIGTVTVEVGQTRHGNTITLSEDCYAIWLYAGPYSSASTGVTATWSDIQIEAGVHATDYVPHLSARDTVLENGVYLKTELSPTFVSNKYINYTNGEEVSLNGAVATSFIVVDPGSYLLLDAVFLSYAGAAFYTNSKEYLSGVSSDWPIYDTGNLRRVLVPEYASYIRVSSLDYVPRIWVMKDKETLYEMIVGNNGKTCASASLFASMGVCGDSYTAAQFWKNDVLLGDNEGISWGKSLAGKTA